MNSVCAHRKRVQEKVKDYLGFVNCGHMHYPFMEVKTLLY